MFGVSLFPPQVLSDLNFFNVKSEKKLASRLRAVQRVAAAAIGAYLMRRYQPILVAKLGSSSAAKIVFCAFFGGYSCLSFPANMLRACVAVTCGHILNAESNIRNKEIGGTVIEVAWVGFGYFVSQTYKYYAKYGPNLLERVFQKVEDTFVPSLYRRFYTEKV